MSDGRVEVEAVLNEAPLKKGVASVKADIKSIEDADRKLDWSGLQKGADAAKQLGDKLTSAGQGLTLKLTTPVLAAGEGIDHRRHDRSAARRPARRDPQAVRRHRRGGIRYRR